MKYRLLAAVLAVPLTGAVYASDITDTFSAGGALAGTLQCQNLSDQPAGAVGDSNSCKGAVSLQPEFDWHPTDTDQVFVKLGFASANGLNERTSLALAPWAADLEDDVKDINGRNRDYLLTAWYKHTFKIGDSSTLGTTFGIIDSTDYLDENAYANDWLTQFMNEALVNGPTLFMPVYDNGAAVEWQSGAWSARGVYMNVGENDDGNSYNFYGVQLGYSVNTSMGEGNYRMIVDSTSQEFLDPSGTRNKRLSSLFFSLDQAFGDVVGGWLRFGWQDDAAAVDYDDFYSGGIDIKGQQWGRPDDNIGIGYAYLSGGNQDMDHAQVLEGYYRWAVNDLLALSADVQYQDGKETNGERARGWVFALRATAEF